MEPLPSSLPLDIHTHHRQSGSTAIYNQRIGETLLANELPFRSIGIHPWELTPSNAEMLWANLLDALSRFPYLALGEAGLDPYAAAPLALQEALFVRQVELSEAKKLPLIIHCVKSADALIRLRRTLRPTQPWVWHGFRGKPQQATQLTQWGFYLSLGQHFPAETLAVIPPQRLLMETDESHLSIQTITERAAGILQIFPQQLTAILHENVANVFFGR